MARGKTGARQGRKSGGGWRRVAVGLGILLLLLLVPAGQMAWSWFKLQRPYKGYEEPEKLVTVEPGMGASQVLQTLEKNGVLADAKLARTYLIYFMGDPKIQAGEYRFQGPLTTAQVLRMLVKGQIVNRSVTII